MVDSTTTPSPAPPRRRMPRAFRPIVPPLRAPEPAPVPTDGALPAIPEETDGAAAAPAAAASTPSPPMMIAIIRNHPIVWGSLIGITMFVATAPVPGLSGPVIGRRWLVALVSGMVITTVGEWHRARLQGSSKAFAVARGLMVMILLQILALMVFVILIYLAFLFGSD